MTSITKAIIVIVNMLSHPLEKSSQWINCTGANSALHADFQLESHHWLPPTTPTPTVLHPGDRRLLRVVIRVADIMKVIVIRANVPRSQDTVALFGSKAQHWVPLGMQLIALSFLT